MPSWIADLVRLDGEGKTFRSSATFGAGGRLFGGLIAAQALAAAGATVETKNYPGLTHEEIAMALSATFRGRGPVLQDSAAFLKAQMP